jgi:hypothetical protein
MESLSTLPHLAWLASIRGRDPVVRVLHGSWVETLEDYFVEGAWDAPFAFDRTDFSPDPGRGPAFAHGLTLRPR